MARIRLSLGARVKVIRYNKLQIIKAIPVQLLIIIEEFLVIQIQCLSVYPFDNHVLI